MADGDRRARERYAAMFRRATETAGPLPYQERLALDSPFSSLLDIPTGLGKTAAAILAWVWRRRFAGASIRSQTTRRLVYCLPMRVLVEQTYGETVRWLERLGLLAGEATWESTGEDGLPTRRSRLAGYEPDPADSRMPGWAADHGDSGTHRIAVHLLMGGEERTDWAIWPERDAVLIGTQDMLLSRALNRGYASRRPRWPIEFGLLNNDCLWVFDEVQLMGPGLATGLQLEAFRSADAEGGPYFCTERRCFSWYMSATASRKLLTSREWRAADGDKRPPNFVFGLSPAEKEEREGVLGRRRLATKRLEYLPSWSITDKEAANRVLSRHHEMLRALDSAPRDIPRRTIIICNTVERARKVHEDITNASAGEVAPEVVLLHSRFRPPDRARQQDRLKTNLDVRAGQIVVATQVVEAGVDLSSAILWTEVAPLPSIVQRLGRLNRAGEFGHDGRNDHGWTPVAVLLGVPLPSRPARQTKEEREKHERRVSGAYLPYDRGECESALQTFQNVHDASPANLDVEIRPALERALLPPDYSLQRHELLDFFDTDSNLSLGYTDVSPFVRGLDRETDIYVVWRKWDGDVPPYDFDIGRDEICHVPIWSVIGSDRLRFRQQGFVWQGRERGWQAATRDNLLPGATLLLPTSAGGYEDRLGWTGESDSNAQVSDLYQPFSRPTDEELRAGLERGWQSIEAHTTDVLSCWSVIREALAFDDIEVAGAIEEAILWHDYGKSIRRWQAATRLLACKAEVVWPRGIAPIAKFSISESPQLADLSDAALYWAIRSLRRVFAPKLRHEVASALALRHHHRRGGHIPTIHELLAEYLAMAHHGHVRKTLRDELPRDPRRIRRGPDEVRGIRQGTPVPGFSIGESELPATEALSIACRRMGRCSDGSESWTQAVLRLLNHFGPFRLAYYEALVRAADWRASAEPATDVQVVSPRDSDKSLADAKQKGAGQ